MAACMSLRRLLFGAGLVVWLAAGAGMAQHNYQNYLVGDRASGMGGAVVASADSVDACYYNPAGLTRLPGNTISLSGSLYGRQTYQAEDAFYAGEDFKYESFVTIPTTIGGLWKVSEQNTLAFAVFMPDRNSSSEMSSFRDGLHVYNYNSEDQTLWIGPSAAWAVNSELALGGAVYAVYRSFNEYFSLLYRDEEAGYARGRKFNDWGVLASFGAQYQALEKLRLGILAQTPSLHVWGDGSYQYNLVAAAEAESLYLENMETDNRTPAQISVGAAWIEPRRYTLELDVSYYFGSDFDLQSWGEGDERLALKIRREEVVNFNLGAEYYFREIYPLRAGFFTDFSAAPGVDPEDQDNVPRIDAYGLSASIGKKIEHVSVNFGLIYVFGSGRTLGWRNLEEGMNLAPTAARQENLYLVVNTAYMF